jgi:type VI protein secretion system component VasK
MMAGMRTLSSALAFAQFDGSVFVVLFLCAAALFIYLFPSLMAIKRDAAGRAGVIVVNLFLGWTLIGWVVALAWAASGETRRQREGRSGVAG